MRTREATTPVPEWDGQKVEMALEEDMLLDEKGKASWILRRQSEFHLIK